MRALILIGLLMAGVDQRGLTPSEPEAASSNESMAAVPLYKHSYALVIGVSRYTSPWTNLPNAAQDAHRVARALEEHGFEVEVVADEKAAQGGGGADDSVLTSLTGDRIAGEIKRFLVTKGAEANARLLIWYSGHGATVRGEGFLLGVDAPGDDAPDFALRAVQMRDIGNWFRLAQARHVLAVFDSCFGATVFEPRYQVRPTMTLKRMMLAEVRQFITSGGPQEQVPDESVFLDYFLGALHGLNPANLNDDVYLTGNELGAFLASAVHYETRGKQTPQFGELVDERYDRGEFVFKWKGEDHDGTPIPLIPPSFHREPGDVDIETPGQQWVPTPFRDCSGCPEIVTLRPGQFVGDDSRAEEILEEFSIGVYEVTFEEWDLCVREGGCRRLPSDAGWGRGRRPVINVNRAEVFEYLQWIAGKTGYSYRLPTEKEWRYAALSLQAGAYWFGDRMQKGRANCRGCGVSRELGTLEVGSFGISSDAPCDPQRAGGENCFGLHDVHGNVWEWVCAADDDGGACALGGSDTTIGVVRGGSWANNASYARADSRAVISPDTRSSGVGFRVVRDPGPARPRP